MDYYPVFLNLRRKKVVVIGGGLVAQRKVCSLTGAGASVTVISPVLTGRLRTMKEKGSIMHHARGFRRGDLKDAFAVIAATNSEKVNRQIAAEAPGLVNVVDVPALCNFIAPSVVRRGLLVIAISSSGVSPALSKAVRQEIEHLYGSEFARYLRFTKTIRTRALSEIASGKKRGAFLRGLGSAKILDALRKKGFSSVREEVIRGLEKILAGERGEKDEE